ncbi:MULTISPECIES: flagellar export protein FliJ [Bacillus]|uniref:flagellar export protein FliJ n=1 Tax=Bacillus TaxID=1386 RepID=UPI000BB776A7|nr:MULTISPECIES: flagellar export protein FliJ [Bacillus]
MQTRGRLKKILVVKEAEKNFAKNEYDHALNEFEQEGQELYELLKKKEHLEGSLRSSLQHGISVDYIKQQQYFVNNLEKSLLVQQRKVSHARAFMNVKAEKLKEHSIECKKYERLDEKEQKLFQQIETKLESKFIDELSILQYSHQTYR